LQGQKKKKPSPGADFERVILLDFFSDRVFFFFTFFQTMTSIHKKQRLSTATAITEQQLPLSNIHSENQSRDKVTKSKQTMMCVLFFFI
jgi:hypothetical protein